MRIVKPGFEFLGDVDGVALMKNIERAKRVCYKSEDKITEDSYKDAVRDLIARGHDAMLEHGSISVIVTCDRGVSHEIVRHRLASYAQESSRYCVSGDSVITFKNPHVNMTIKQLYEKRVANKSGAWKRLMIRQYDEDAKTLTYAKVKDVFYNGKRECIKIKTKLGYTIQCTGNHIIYTPSGQISASDLQVGDSIFVNGTAELYRNYDWLYHQNITLDKTFVQISNDFGFGVSVLKKWARKLGIPKKGTGYFHIGHKPWNAGISHKDDERVLRQVNAMREHHHCGRRDDKILKCNTTKYQKHMTGECSICKATKSLEVHHVDFDHSNNFPENLITLCESCHLRVHSQNLLTAYGDIIVAIEASGEFDVYDLEIDSKYHNYVANGVVVHNCNYSKDKFGHEITVIEPCFFTPGTCVYDEWERGCEAAEKAYFKLLELGRSPQEARDVLPNSTKTEIVITMNPREWRHFFKLRACGASGKPHPQMLEIAVPMLDAFKAKFPELFDDLEGIEFESKN